MRKPPRVEQAPNDIIPVDNVGNLGEYNESVRVEETLNIEDRFSLVACCVYAVGADDQVVASFQRYRGVFLNIQHFELHLNITLDVEKLRCAGDERRGDIGICVLDSRPEPSDSVDKPLRGTSDCYCKRPPILIKSYTFTYNQRRSQ